MDYTKNPKFEWDINKSNQCERSRGFNFTFASKAFFSTQRLILIDNRNAYDEERFILYAPINDRLYCIVYTLRGERIRIISARKANPREVHKYANRLLHTRS